MGRVRFRNPGPPRAATTRRSLRGDRERLAPDRRARATARGVPFRRARPATRRSASEASTSIPSSSSASVSRRRELRGRALLRHRRCGCLARPFARRRRARRGGRDRSRRDRRRRCRGHCSDRLRRLRRASCLGRTRTDDETRHERGDESRAGAGNRGVSQGNRFRPLQPRHESSLRRWPARTIRVRKQSAARASAATTGPGFDAAAAIAASSGLGAELVVAGGAALFGCADGSTDALFVGA